MSLYLSFQLLLILSATISIGLLGYALRYRYVPGALAFVLIIAGEGIWTIGYFAELRAELLIGKIAWDNIQFIGVDLAAIGMLVFALVYTHQDMLLRRFGALLGIEPIANILLVWTDPAHHLVRIAPQINTAGAFPALVYSYGPWMWVMIAHAYLLIAVTLVLLVRESLDNQRLYRRQILAITLGLVVPLIGSFITVAGLVPIAGMASLDLTPITFAIANPILAWGVFRYRLLNLAPVARHRVVEQMADGVIVLDRNGRIADINPAACTTLKVAPGVLIGQPTEQVFADWAELIVRYRDVESVREELTVAYQGVSHYIDLQISPLTDRRSRVTGRLIVWHDITERKQAELELVRQTLQLERQTLALQQAKDAAEAASRAKSAFLSSMSHELRTPLTAILGYTELIETDLGEGETDQIGGDIARIKTSGEHLLGLISSVLDYSKIEAGKLVLDLTTFAIADLMDELATLARPLVEHQGNRLVVECPPAIGTMHADIIRTRQILLNLLSNAAKFTRQGQVTLRASRSVGVDGVSIVFEVIDTGIGMDTEQIGQLFQEFMQIDLSSEYHQGGTGLGLALSRQLCRLMGGDIAVVSQLHVGSTFTAIIPAHVAESADLAQTLRSST